MKTEQFQIKKTDIAQTRVVSHETPALEDGEILTKVDRFALTANNITYGVVGEKIGYWKFFPVDDEWGIIPVWGFADVVESKHPDVEAGERVYGYYPMATHLVLRPGKIRAERLIDTAAHRAELPPVYNSYARTAAESHYDPAMDDERMLLFPLYATSFCIYDFLRDNDYYHAKQIVIPSASSKTAIGLGYALDIDSSRPATVGLTSPGNEPKVAALGLYDEVVTYENLQEIDNSAATVIVDMSGNGKLLSDLHLHFGDKMKFTSNVGITHYDANDMGPHFIRERSAMFFAPGHIQKRTRDWGPGEFEKRAFSFWYEASMKSRSWLNINRTNGIGKLAGVYASVLEGKMPPDEGVIVCL